MSGNSFGPGSIHHCERHCHCIFMSTFRRLNNTVTTQVSSSNDVGNVETTQRTQYNYSAVPSAAILKLTM
jgi:hypothetical protein